MRLNEDYAPQYGKPCVLIIWEGPEDGEPTIEPNEVLEFARKIGALYEEEPNSFCFVVQFPGRPQELFTERALLSSLNPLKPIR